MPMAGYDVDQRNVPQKANICHGFSQADPVA
jgi:hypothetical protein